MPLTLQAEVFRCLLEHLPAPESRLGLLPEESWHRPREDADFRPGVASHGGVLNHLPAVLRVPPPDC